MIRILYLIYQTIIAAPLFLVATIIVSLLMIIGSSLGFGNFWGYYPARWWGWLTVRLFFLPVTVKGRENLKDDESYVFVANHQGAFDIFLVYGFLRRNFKWMMKWQLSKIPFVGYACKKSNQIFVDKRGPRKVKETYDKARAILKSGMSVMVFPEGSRSFTGHMGTFKKGAFALADELQLPVVPLTIYGPFDVMPRMRDGRWCKWHPLSLTIHKPIYPSGSGAENVEATMKQSYETVMSALPLEYQGYVHNPDQ